ncbi:hypothetical protein BBJ28_00005613 [Nothophytophthora sp. Chile5]|nr:hypothetical protein BBJ28_00005613 [Nothophytophthora sp. Chile5]
MEEEDLPIVTLPDEYSFDGERLGMTVAHVSAQVNHIAETQTGLQECQHCHEQEQHRFVEERVAAARLEAKARNNSLVLAIRQTYDDTTTLELRMDARIQSVLAQLQEAAQKQARAVAEEQLADQTAAQQLVEHRMNEALNAVQAQTDMRTEERINSLIAAMRQHQDTTAQELRQAAQDRTNLLHNLELASNRTQQVVQHAEEATRLVANSEISACLEGALETIQMTTIERTEFRIVELVKGGFRHCRRDVCHCDDELQAALTTKRRQR